MGRSLNSGWFFPLSPQGNVWDSGLSILRFWYKLQMERSVQTIRFEGLKSIGTGSKFEISVFAVV